MKAFIQRKVSYEVEIFDQGFYYLSQAKTQP
jgi:hypothetical protein